MTHILQAFEMCRAGEFNLSHESLVCLNAHEKLCNLKQTNPAFWNELTEGQRQKPAIVGVVMEDNMDTECEHHMDDSDLMCNIVVANTVHGNTPAGVQIDPENGQLVSTVVSEALEYQLEMAERPEWANDVASGEGSSS